MYHRLKRLCHDLIKYQLCVALLVDFSYYSTAKSNDVTTISSENASMWRGSGGLSSFQPGYLHVVAAHNVQTKHDLRAGNHVRGEGNLSAWEGVRSSARSPAPHRPICIASV